MSAKSTFRTYAMPVGMIIGALFCRPIAKIDAMAGGLLTPIFICTMLFLTFCRVDARRIRFSWMHLWLIIFQIVGSFAVFHLLKAFDLVLAQGAMICVLAPVAMAAVVIAGMLGANLETMAAYTLLCNVVIAIFAPFMLHAYGNGECTMWQILQRVAPMLIGPFVAGQLCRLTMRRVSDWVAQHKDLSFYIWLMSLMVIIGRTSCFILDQDEVDRTIELLLAVVALVICLLQFAVGRYVGCRYGDTVAGGQSLGQKNTVLAVWLSQAFLDPISSVAPTAYIVWQNLVNSYQLWRAERQRERDAKC